MARDTVIDVWNEITISGSGIGITLYSETAEGTPRVEDETWFTFDELDDEVGSIISLNLSDDSRSLLNRSLETKTERLGHLLGNDFESDDEEESDLPEVGDALTDKGAPSWSDENWVEVVEVLEDVRCDEYVIQGPNENLTLNPISQSWSDKTVDDANPTYPADDAVVIAQYGGSGDEYAFPASRLV